LEGAAGRAATNGQPIRLDPCGASFDDASDNLDVPQLQ
jgi:hypothetical protein